jgi:hypothetical protein
MLLHREQDGASKVYLGQLKTTLNRFAAKFPGEILDITSQEIDAWLRSLDVAPGTRNSMLRCIKVFFSFARSRNYLPEDRSTAADSVRLIRSASDRVTIFTPQQMETILHAAPPHRLQSGPLRPSHPGAPLPPSRPPWRLQRPVPGTFNPHRSHSLIPDSPLVHRGNGSTENP